MHLRSLRFASCTATFVSLAACCSEGAQARAFLLACTVSLFFEKATALASRRQGSCSLFENALLAFSLPFRRKGTKKATALASRRQGSCSLFFAFSKKRHQKGKGGRQAQSASKKQPCCSWAELLFGEKLPKVLPLCAP